MSFKPKKKILIISLSVILVLAFSLVYVNFFMPKTSTPTTTTTKIKSNNALKPKKSSPTENSKNQESTNETVNSKPSETNTSSQNSSPNNIKPASPKETPKPSISNFKIEDSNIKTLLHNGDMAIRDFYSSAYVKNSNTKNPIELDNRTYSEMIPDITSYNSLKDFMRKNYNLNSYYTESFIRKFMDETFRYINGKYYIVVGNYGLMLRYDNTFKVISKTYSGNLLYLKISSYSDGDTSPNTSNAVLYYSGNNWFIYRFDAWGIPSLAN